MFRVLSCLAGDHDLRLVLLAGVVCFLASLAAVNLFNRARATAGRARAAWLATAGSATGCGIWATHFIAMLAYDPGVGVGYDIALTALSLVAAAIITGMGLTAAVVAPARWGAPLGGAIVGAGVACMHYLGMSALEVPGRVAWSVDLVVTSIVLGMLLGAVALAVAVRSTGAKGTAAAALLLTLAIVAHHFTAMGAVEIVPDPSRLVDIFLLSPAALSLAIAGVAIAVLAMSLAGAFADRRMHEQNVRLDTALNNMSQGLLMFDAEGKLLVCNKRYVEMYRLTPEIAKPGASLRRLIQHRIDTRAFTASDPDRHVADLRSAITQGRSLDTVSELMDGRTIAISRRPMVGGGWVATHEDVTEKKRAEDRIVHMAHHDVLTDLPNRAAFKERLEATLEKAAKANDSFAILCIDLDRFKEVNDVFGHSAGDALLREAARRLNAAAAGAFMARLGGDEFTLIAAEGPQPATAAALAERLLATLADDLDIDGHRLRAGLSIGVSIYPADATDTATLLAYADAALYRAKAEGRGTVRFFEPGMDKRLRERRALEHDLRSAVENGELALHYQPQQAIGGEIIGFEALLRWQHPVRGTVPPGIFIPVAEESGLIMALGEWALREACREAAAWPRKLQIAVNLSPVQFRHGDLAALVHAILLETGLCPGRLELEITENVLIGDFSTALSILRRIKALGVRIAMDDFGTGYSSLSYLQSFPFDTIKIDRSFITNVDSNQQSAAIVRAVIGLARGLGVPVVAEGVETNGELALLSREACDEVQGFLIGRPFPIANYGDIIGCPMLAQSRPARAV